MIQPEHIGDAIELVELEAVLSNATHIVAWRDLQDDGVWRQGWV
ncbi:MAG: TIGR02450 family Trp-rich protein [Burkholderiaceae bacterium]